MRTVLHVGCGSQSKEVLPPFNWDYWREIRVDIDPEVKPDIVDDIVTLSKVEDASADFLFSKHNVEHLDFHDVPTCFRNFHRVLKDTGFLTIRTPDLTSLCEFIVKHGPERSVFTSTIDGERHEVRPLDILFGAGWAIERGNAFMAHRTGFNKESITRKLTQAGFEFVDASIDPALCEIKLVAIKKIEGNIYWPLLKKTPPDAA